MTLDLNYSDVIQGSFKPTDLNLMMIFQVNCPGCFLQGFPQIISLHTKYQDRLSCFALSTAFEDFDLNTEKNTRLLLEKSILVGETKRAFDARDLKWEAHIPFPVLIDTIIVNEEMLSPHYIERVISNQPKFRGVSQLELEKVKISFQNYFNHYPKCGATFATNLLRGTPTFILFDNRMNILLQWFGHVDINLVEKKLSEYFTMNTCNDRE